MRSHRWRWQVGPRASPRHRQRQRGEWPLQRRRSRFKQERLPAKKTTQAQLNTSLFSPAVVYVCVYVCTIGLAATPCMSVESARLCAIYNRNKGDVCRKNILREVTQSLHIVRIWSPSSRYAKGSQSHALPLPNRNYVVLQGYLWWWRSRRMGGLMLPWTIQKPFMVFLGMQRPS